MALISDDIRQSLSSKLESLLSRYGSLPVAMGSLISLKRNPSLLASSISLFLDTYKIKGTPFDAVNRNLKSNLDGRNINTALSYLQEITPNGYSFGEFSTAGRMSVGFFKK